MEENEYAFAPELSSAMQSERQMECNMPMRSMEQTPVRITRASGIPGIYLNAAAMNHLVSTRPWARFISIFLFIVTGFSIISALVMFAIGFFDTNTMYSAKAETSSLQMISGTIAGFIYIALAIVYIPMGFFLSRYAGDINGLEIEHSAEMLESALKQQKLFWRYTGIVIISGVCLSLLTMLAGIIVGLSVGASIAK